MEHYPLPMPLEPRPRRSRNGLKLAAIAPLVLVLTACSKVSGLGYKEGLSSVNDTTLPLWQTEWITAGFVGVLVVGLILWASIFHRKKNEDFPKQTQYHIPIEIAYTAIPLIIILVLFGLTARAESSITNKSLVGVKHDITVNGMQWSWQFTYPEAGTGPNATITGTPQQRPILYLPQGERIRLTLTSSDVDHGFWIPAFMIQMQNLPGVTNHLEFTAYKLGDYPGRCDILCGRDHSLMQFTVRVVTPTQYDDYINSLKASQS
jgi:cytochrome c oxidase subunit 2